ncbi:MAG: SpoVA/SpoVAEb family sporulation membrane protein [Clostridia bacterium]|nr:SpoVA/SpoVAEb family sporulation membrane protein [Clostridia bacterium]
MIFTSISNGEYGRMAKKASPPSSKIKNGFLAFVIGGLVCALGEGFGVIYSKIGMSQDNVKLMIPVTLIVIAAVLTALGVFDKIAYYAGAGTIVPITGFANAIVSPAMEFKSEGQILGTGANMFRIAGPVIVYGTLAAVIYGVVYYMFLR